MDVFQKCDDFTLTRELRAGGVYPYYRPITSPQEPIVELDGESIVMLGSNNYLGLTNHPEVKEAAIHTLEKYGTGCAGSRLLNGSLELHTQLEERLARFMNRPAVVVFATGYQANVGALSSLLDRHDTVFLDSLDHASIIDGARLSYGKTLKFKHNDMADLDGKLSRTSGERGRMIVVDGVFSMEGDIADLPGLAALRRKHGVRLMVDDAHSLGVLGEHGRGTAEHFGCEHEVDLIMGTFSKTLATVGGFIAGDENVVEFLRHNARAQVFSASIPPAAVAAVMKALDIVEREPERRKQLWENTNYVHRELKQLGFDTGVAETPIIPLLVGDDMRTFTMATRLQEEGVFVNPIVTPATAPGRAMIRTSYMATHTRAHLDRALEAFEKVGRELHVI